MTQEGGHIGRIESLSGKLSRDGLGRIVTSVYWDPNGGIQIPANPSREWLLMTNEGSVIAYFRFGSPATVYSHKLNPGDTLQIDGYMPWSGSIGLYSAATTYLAITEVSIQE